MAVVVLTDIGIALTDVGIVFTGIMFTDIGVALTDIGIALTGIGIASTDIGIVSTDIGIVLTDIGIVLLDIGIVSTDIGIVLTDVGVDCYGPLSLPAYLPHELCTQLGLQFLCKITGISVTLQQMHTSSARWRPPYASFTNLLQYVLTSTCCNLDIACAVSP